MLVDTPVCDFGWEAPEFELKDFDGKAYNLDQLMGNNGILIAFICNHCPYVQAIIDRLVADAKALKEEGINTVAIMSNDYSKYPDDSPKMMKQFADQHNIFFPYLVDETQDVAKVYDAVCTPDFFGFNSNKELQYRGRLDDAKMGNSENRKEELLEAMTQVAKTGVGPKDQIPSMGCNIKWK